MKNFSAFILSCILFLTSCASHHPGTKAQNVDPQGMIVSAERISALSDSKNSMIVFTFENKGGDWERIKSATFSCGRVCDLKSKIILGNDLVAWTQSQRIKRNISEHNQTLLFSGLIVLGVVAALAGASHGSVGRVNTGAAIAGAGMAGDSYSKVKNAQLETKLGRVNDNTDHIFNPFAIPADGLAKKWILVNTPSGEKPTEVHLTLETEDGEFQDYTVKL